MQMEMNQNFLGWCVWAPGWVSSMKLLSSPKSIFHLDDLNFFRGRVFAADLGQSCQDTGIWS